MGTRASFWIGNPQQLDKREWLGCIAFDGYPEGIEGIGDVKTELQFRTLVGDLAESRSFAKPEGGWPYPWAGDIFLTDYTYAFFGGQLRLTVFHSGWQTLEAYYADAEREAESDLPPALDKLPGNVPAPKQYDPTQPDSIIIASRK